MNSLENLETQFIDAVSNESNNNISVINAINEATDDELLQFISENESVFIRRISNMCRHIKEEVDMYKSKVDKESINLMTLKFIALSKKETNISFYNLRSRAFEIRAALNLNLVVEG